MKAEELENRLLYRDSLMLVIDKPSGIPVHGGPKGGDNLERHFDALRFGLPRTPALAHRLDRDTSGCLILGRHPKALRKLGKLFAEGKIQKTYWAIVAGTPSAPSGTIDLPLKKTTPKGGWKMTGSTADDPDAKPAVTDWRVMGQAGSLTWLELKPRSGRTHQIRVHLQAIGCPIVGDAVYGAGLIDDASRLHLHARGVVVPLYPSRAPITVTAPPPPHMARALKACGGERLLSQERHA